MNDNKMVPEIRFKDYTSAWEQRKLGEVAEFSNEKRIPIDAALRTSGEYPYYGATGIIDYVHDYIFDGEYVLLAEDGANIIARSSPIAYLASGKFWLNNHAHIMRMKAGNNNFLLQLLEKQNYLSLNTGTAQPKLNAQVLKGMTLNFPAPEEQTAIGHFFATLDKTITLYKQKLDGLKTLKKGYLQQMFPQAGESVPKVRFAGFSGEWEGKALGEMLTERNEQIEESEEYPLMSFVGNVGVVPKGEQYDRSFLVKGADKKYKKTELNDFIYSSNNLETGSIGFNRTGNAVISPVYSIFYSNNDSESQFVGLLSKRKDFINKMIHYRQGVMYGQWRIHEKDFLKITVLSPSTAEQNKIIQFFHTIDEQITAQSQKVEQIQQLKKAYLQKMFI